MVFTSPTFLFLFLPVVLAAFAVTPKRFRTSLLVAASWLFYAWGEKHLVLLLALSTAINWALALLLDRAAAPHTRRLLLTIGVIVNIGALVYFKYTNFLVLNLSALLEQLGAPAIEHAPVHLPIGISFVTFEALSYVVDVYRRHTPAARNPVHVAFYLSFFPHLIAGPILRFADIAAPLPRPTVTLERLDLGVSRFINGLGKKMLLANPLGHAADQIFALPAAELGTPTAWLGIVCYALQIYFDFSGYSDMAIGMGHMFGFTLPENFRHPYTAESIRDFWRRWHISLSSWFRDYLFVPLGGNRGGRLKTYRNLLTVFLLCGFWHGASWTFVVWGLFHGVFLVLERTRFGAALAAAPVSVRRVYALLVVLVGWVFFRAETFTGALSYLAAMFGRGGPAAVLPMYYLSLEVQIALVVAAFLATRPLQSRLIDVARTAAGPALRAPAVAVQAAVLALSLLYVAAGTYNPFIYFRF
jgi:alginate O-acetyltransferase complex protein AlgI